MLSLRKVFLVLLVCFFVLSAFPAMIASAAPPDDAESKHIQEEAAAEKFESQTLAASSPILPSTIRVLRTASNSVEVVNFKDYVKNVLPNEWIASWNMEALKSGAMAVKTYAWYWTIYQKYPGKGYDVKDDISDQVYKPNSSDPRTNQAIEETWNWVMTKNNAIFQSQYDSGSTGSPDPINPGRMSQWGTLYWAEKGKEWSWMLHYYYDPIEIKKIDIAAISTYNTILDDLDELVSEGKIAGYDLYTDSNIADLWTNLDQYRILLIDEDCMFEWTNPGPDYNRPIPITTVGSSFYNHKAELLEWINNGGGLFSTDEDDISLSYTDADNVWWTWLPDEIQVESNQYPSDYPDIGYGHYPENLIVVYDPWIFSTPNKIDITKVDKMECHGRFTKYPGYQALVRDKSDGDVLEIYRAYGSGIVVLSHLEYETADPWDADYVENEIRGLERLDVRLELYIEDSDKLVLVNKAPGDLIDIVAQLKNNEKQTLNVTVAIQVPASFGFNTSFIRNNFADLNEVTVSSNDLGGGKYEVVGSLESGEAKQVIWRFRIPDDFNTTANVTVSGDVKAAGIFCDGDTTSFAMVDNTMSIIVTNRKLLFERYGDGVVQNGSDDVLKLLRELYFLSDWRTYSGTSCILYYVDYYDNAAKNWDQSVNYTDETTANRVVNIIDDYIEQWEKNTNPPYLIIVGGDETIPFYRVSFPGYTEEHYSSSDPVLNTYDHDYFLTDMKYADSDDTDWTKGSIDLMTGRITGASASDMKRLIENGLHSPADSSNAVVGCDDATPDLVNSIARLRDNKQLNILNDGQPSGETPITFNTGTGWGASDLVDAMKEGFSIFDHTYHGDYWKFDCPNADIESDDELSNDIQLIRSVTECRPYFTTDSCHTGVITDENDNNWMPAPDDNLAWALAHIGASGYLAQMSFGLIPESDTLLAGYYDHLIKASAGETTNPVGESLRYAINNYDPGWDWFGLVDPWSTREKIAVTEPVLYGVPWMTIDPPVSSKLQENSNDDLEISISKPEYVSPNMFKATIGINVTNYSISNVNGFDIVNISGSDEIREDGYPILPKVSVAIDLPLNAGNIGLSMTGSNSTGIGPLNIPCLAGGFRTGYSEPRMTTCTGMGTLFPLQICGFTTRDFDSYKRVVVSSALAQWDPGTNLTTLYNSSTLELTYETPITITVTDFSPDKTEYTGGDTVNASVTVENVGSDDLTNLKANLSLKDPQRRIAASNEETFDITSGESKIVYVTLVPNISHGVYLAEMNILGSGVLASSSSYLTIKTGEIVDFACPSEVKGGDVGNFAVSFRNGYQTSVEATGVIYIYDKDNIKVAEIYSVPVQISANSTCDIDIPWDTTGRAPGDYTASAIVVDSEQEQFGPAYGTFELVLRGDANGDGVVNTGDITKVKRIYFGMDLPTNRADVNGDGKIDTGDITAIRLIYFS